MEDANFKFYDMCQMQFYVMCIYCVGLACRSMFAERLDQDTSGILTTICNHSFHCSCISKWTDSSCPVSKMLVGEISLFCVMGPTNVYPCGFIMLYNQRQLLV